METSHASKADLQAEPMQSLAMTTRPVTKADYDHIVKVIDHWWGGPSSALAHPIFFYELGETAMVIETEGQLVGFLFGFVSPQGPTGYVHLVGIHPDFRRQHVGSQLYQSFEVACERAGCLTMKAITTSGNEASIRFHLAQGWDMEERADYAGPGRTRLVFNKQVHPKE